MAQYQVYVINRYPIMATLAYVIAKKRKFNDDLSKSLGLGVATGYAILKNVGLSLKTITPFNYRSKAVKKQKPTLEDKLFSREDKDFNDYEYIYHCGIEFIKMKNSNDILGIRRIRGNQQNFTADKFDNKVKNRLNYIKPDGFNFLCNLISKDVDNNLDVNNLLGHQYFNFWKKYRDVWRDYNIWFNNKKI